MLTKSVKILGRSLRLATVVALSLCVGVLPAFPQAALLPNAKQTFLDQNGDPLSLGKVYLYVPNTATPKTTWSNSTQTAINTNPVVLDAAGRGVIYGQGSYSQKVTDSADNQQWNALTTAYGASAPTGATGTDTAPVGTVMPYSGFVVPTNWQFAYGQAVSRTTFSDLKTAITVSDATVSCISGSATLTGFASTAQFRIGAPIEATCIPTSTTVATIASATSITVSAMAVSTATVTGVVFPWGNGDGTTTFNVPDLRGRSPVGPDSMGGTAANVAQVATTVTTTSGSPTATVASATRVAAGQTIVSANVPAGTTVSSIAGTTVTMSSNASASASGTAATFQAFASANAPAASGGSITHTLTTAELAAHTHANTLTDPTHVHGSSTASATGSGGGSAVTYGSGNASLQNVVAASTGVTITNVSTGSSAPLSIVQPSLTINYIIKMAPNTTGLGGVVSIGGMFGDILCGALVTCSSQTISFAPFASVSANQIFSGPTTGADAAPAFRAMVSADLPSGPVISGHPTVEGITSTGATGTGKFVFDSAPTLVNPVVTGSLTATGLVANAALTSTADSTIKSNISGGAASPSDNTITGVLDKQFGTTQGSVVYRGASSWAALTPGTSGQLLSSGGAAANPSWITASGTGTVTSAQVAAGQGIAVTGTCTITATGVCTVAVSLSTASNVLSGDVSLSNTANYFDGPSAAQGTTGTWFASGTVTLTDTTSGAFFSCKLWDGTTVVSSGRTLITAVNFPVTMSLSGYLASPAANMRISCKDETNATGKILFNASGNSKDSSLWTIRII